MTAFNVVRMRVKPGRADEFIAAHKKLDAGFPGMRKVSLVRTGDDSFCIVGEWDKFDDIVAARPHMGAILSIFREFLEDLGGGLGVTDPVSGSVLVEHIAAKAKPAKTRPVRRAKAKAKKAARRPAKKAAKKKAKKRR